LKAKQLDRRLIFELVATAAQIQLIRLHQRRTRLSTLHRSLVRDQGPELRQNGADGLCISIWNDSIALLEQGIIIDRSQGNALQNGPTGNTQRSQNDMMPHTRLE